MNILMCFAGTLTRSAGASKVYVELAEALRENGHACDLAGMDELLSPAEQQRHAKENARTGRWTFSNALKRYLQDDAAAYDVVEYQHAVLPFPRSDFPPQPLFVARSVLLYYHLMDAPAPAWNGLLSFCRHFLAESMLRLAHRHSASDRFEVPYASLMQVLRKRMGAALSRRGVPCELRRMIQATVEAADLVNVSNAYDRKRLRTAGVPDAKIHVFPFGLTEIRLAQFEKKRRTSPRTRKPTIAFVGTFDLRKGCTDFPDLVRRVTKAVPEARFRLLGTGGWLVDEHEVLAFFPQRLRRHIEVIPSFAPDALPDLLADCSLGVFPSYVEGFGFGVLEMLAAALPVMAYDAPGPPEMVLPEWLVAPGDTGAMSRKIVALLRRPQRLEDARQTARARAERFVWKDIAERTVATYRTALANRRSERLTGNYVSNALSFSS